MTPALFLDFAKTYFRLSRAGRRWIRARSRGSRHRPKSAHFPLLDEKKDRRDILHKLLICDRTFRDDVPDDLLRRMGRERRLVYGRFVPFALINLLLRCRLLEAYGLPYDRAAETRLVKQILLWRELNDLRESHGFEATYEVQKREGESEPRPSFLLLDALIRAVRRAAPPEEYTEYEHLRRTYMERIPSFVTREPTEDRLQVAAAFSLRHGYAIMFTRVPEVLIEPTRCYAQWCYGLDELSDFHRDKSAGKATYFGGLADPLKEIWRLYGICEDRFRREAPAPEKLLPLMKFLTEVIAKAHETGRDIESEVFGAPGAAAVNRTEGPSGSGTATQT